MVIVRPHAKPNSIFPEQCVVDLYRRTALWRFLISDGNGLSHFEPVDLHDELATFVESDDIRAVERNRNPAWICVGFQQKIVFETAIARMIESIDSVVDRLILHLAELRDVGLPRCRVTTNEVVAPPFQW